MGVIVEKFADEKGLIWPENIAPARVYLVQIGEKSRTAADELYEALGAQGVEVLYDERDERPGVKFADAELMGIPLRVTVSDRLLDGKEWEVVARASGERQLLTTDELLATLE